MSELRLAKKVFCLASAFCLFGLHAEEIDEQKIEAKSAEEDDAGQPIAKKQEKEHFSVNFSSDFSVNREEWNSPDQNAYASFKLLPRYKFNNGWSTGLNLGAVQRVKPIRLWRWSDIGITGGSPKFNLGSGFSVRVNPSISLPTSEFSHDELQLRLSAGLSGVLVYTLSKAETWALNTASYSLGFNRKFYKYKTDIAGNTVTEWIISHTVGFSFALFKKLSFEPSFTVDSEFRSSGKIFNSYAIEGDLGYEICDWLSANASVSNSGDSFSTQQQYGKLGQFISRDTQFTLGLSLSY